MLLDRLTQEEFLSCNFKEYYTFALHGVTGSAHDVRFSLSASSIDRLLLVCRDGNYQTSGQKTRLYTGATLADSNCSNFLHFKSFNSSNKKRGSLKYQFSVNSVSHPVYQADTLDAAHELLMISDQHPYSGRGNMITSMTDFNDGKAIFPLQLSMPGQPVNLMSGYNSRGNNTQFSVSLQGQVVPTASADEQITR